MFFLHCSVRLSEVTFFLPLVTHMPAEGANMEAELEKAEECGKVMQGKVMERINEKDITLDESDIPEDVIQAFQALSGGGSLQLMLDTTDEEWRVERRRQLELIKEFSDGLNGKGSYKFKDCLSKAERSFIHWQMEINGFCSISLHIIPV